MNIRSVQNYKIDSSFSSISRPPVKTSNPPVSSPNSFCSMPASAYKANFLPSFGKFKTVGNVAILNRETGKTVRANLQREKFGDYICFRLLVNRKEVGYLNMDCDSVFPEKDGMILNELDNNIPKVTHLRSLSGDKYAGIGSALLTVAVEESQKHGKNGALWLWADEGYAHSLSPYRANENPIPFYYKLGFESLDKDIDEKIRHALENSKYGVLPSSTILLLPSSKSEDLKRYYSTHYTYNLA